MALQPVRRRSVPDDVYEQLLGELVAGDLAPGATLPSERRLAEVLGVSRPAVREALQRLSHAGLVEVRQGDATTVRDFRRTGGLELLARLLVRGGRLDVAVARSLLEARLRVGPIVAELAAERAGADVPPRLREVVAALEEDDDPVRRQHLALDFWELVVDSADSIAFRLMFNSLRGAYEPAIDALAGLMAEEVDQVRAYAGLVDAVEAHDGPLARARAEALLGPATTALDAALDALEAK
ncbi:FadR/GntR family transcriptional regulator [Nocardioides caldifontis]|uniref:FadR/GntR family transcriptional regulator n=1 Tax=Nocardioides caldifontis TaxID=2588938 RepID=UPI0011DFC585|nr:GntR family transcriptional regulator [Nocardioides caldifontis]